MKYKLYTEADHTFAICAYKESPYLEECIQSLLNQTRNSKVIIATSTPNAYIQSIALKYEVELYVNDVANGIASDWNFAYGNAHTKLVTIAHQDDIYDKDYLENVLKTLNHTANPILVHTGYYEIRNTEKVYSNKLLHIKRLLLLPITPRFTWGCIALRRFSLSFGSGICCPSVTYVKDRLPETPFETGMKANLDWQAWERYSNEMGEFCFVTKPVMGHRVHEESETSRVIGSGNGRTEEDYKMFLKFWPKPIAKFLVKLYSKGQESNTL